MCIAYDCVLVKRSLHETLPMEIILFKRNKTQLNLNPRLVLIGLSTVWQHNLHVYTLYLPSVANTGFIFIQPKLDHLEMSGMNESKSSLKDGSPVEEKRGFHVLIAKWEESPERNKFYELWEKHGLSIVLLCFTVILLGYSIAAIAVSGFDKAKWLFAITMFLWFCMTYMFIRNHCGGEIYRVVFEPIINAVNSKWKYLRW